MKRIEEMVKLIKSKSSFGFNVSIFLLVSCLIIIPLVDDLLIQLILGAIILLVGYGFVGILQERNRLNKILKYYKLHPEKSLHVVKEKIDFLTGKINNPIDESKEHHTTYNSISKRERELMNYEQLKDAIIEEHPNL